MGTSVKPCPKQLSKAIIKIRTDCNILSFKITCLSDYFETINVALTQDDPFWFRGHSDFHWNLTPSALRYNRLQQRKQALNLISDFKRYMESKLNPAPSPKDNLKWIQIAQHYGLATRLLDWTQNAAIALYFACIDFIDTHGIVFVLNPISLNRMSDPKMSRILDAHNDLKLINQYLVLGGGRNPKGKPTIAINPIWNSDRITRQQGAFTLHGSNSFTLTKEEAPSLVGIPIACNYKQSLLSELERIGINEMAIFPDPDYICKWLMRRSGLLGKD